jgi:hypothetical protein
MKTKLINFIRRYNIGGTVNIVSINSNDKILSASFVSEDRTVIGQVNSYEFRMEEGTIGVYDTDQLLRMLHVLDDNVNIDMIGEENQYTKLALSDGKINANFLLCDINIIPKTPELKLPEFGMKFQLTSEFCNNFVKAYSALSDNEFCTLEPDGQNDVKIIIGPHNNHSMNITLTTPVDTLDDFLMNSITLRACILKDVIVANKDFEQGMMHVSEQGLVKVMFHKVDDFSSKYYLVAEQQDD